MDSLSLFPHICSENWRSSNFIHNIWIWNVKCLVLESVFVNSNTLSAKQVIGIRDVIPPPLRGEFTDVYIATELMDTDLHHIVRSNQGLSEEHCQVIYFSF